MFKKILFIQPPYTFNEDLPLIVEIPLGLCYLAAVARENNFEVKILDALAEGYTNKIPIKNRKIRVGLDFSEIKKRIEEFDPDVVGVSCLFTIQYENAKKILELVKKVDKKIITVMGGMHATVRTESILKDNNLDYAIRGEGEYSFLELINKLNSGKDISEIDGLGYKKRNKIIVNKKIKFIENLDELPLPARDLLKIENYFKANLAHGFFVKGNRNMNVVTSRGCPGGCVFCTIKLVWGSRFRARSPDNVINELKELKEKYNIDHIQFEDDNLTFDIPRAKELFKKMIPLHLKWNTPNGVAAWRMDEETLDLMKQAGCYYVKFAVESGNQRVLNNVIKKPQNLKNVIKLIKYGRKIGLKVGSFFVIGLPGETKEEMQETFDFPMKVRLDWAEYSIATPHYGTELYQVCVDKGYIKEFDPSKLYARNSLFSTDEFSSEWLENKVAAENKRYLLFLLLRQPTTFFSITLEMMRKNPLFAANYLMKILSKK